VFLDRQCLPDGEDYEIQFTSAIKNSSIIILLVSELAIAKIQNANEWADNVLLEYEYALEQQEAGEAVILPLLIPTTRVIEGETFISKFKKFSVDQYPDAPHISPKSGKNIRATMKKLFSLQGIHIDVDNLEMTLPSIAEQITAMEKRRLDKILNGPDGEIIFKLKGKEMKLYVHSKKLYISLVYPNFSMMKNPVTKPVKEGDLLTVFSKIRFDPYTLMVKTNDYTFAASIGKNFNTNDAFVAYGSCGGCDGPLIDDGKARIDLRGTQFAVNDTFRHEGWKSKGTWNFKDHNQVVELTGGGHCGGAKPTRASETDNTNPDGGWILQLALLS
jgi:hypothetical protein